MSDAKLNMVGVPRRRVDGRAKVTGQTKFADDVVMARAAHCKLLRSNRMPEVEVHIVSSIENPTVLARPRAPKCQIPWKHPKIKKLRL